MRVECIQFERETYAVAQHKELVFGLLRNLINQTALSVEKFNKL